MQDSAEIALATAREPSVRERPVGLAVLWALAWLLGLLPFTALTRAGALVGFLAGSVLRIRRAHVERAMRVAAVARPARIAAAMYRGLGASLLELLWLAARKNEPPTSHAAFDSRSEARLADAVAGGRGVVLAASHAGNWELSAAALAASYPLLAVTKRMSVGAVDRFVRDARAARGIDLATRDDAFARARRMLRSGGVVAMMIDQVPDRRRHGLPVTFLGATALADRAPAALAAQMRAPLVVAASMRVGAVTSMRVLAVLDPPSDAHGRRARRAWIDEATRRASDALDAFVRAHPADWLWMHRRWRFPAR